jgi:hypothetical protein
MNDRQLAYRTNIPKSYKNNYTKAIEGNSRKEALKAKCLDCMCWQKDEIKICEIDWCPLWPYRPYQNKVNKVKK